MEIRLLEQFVAVAETLHFGRAAERLHMSQPPLSVAMQRLEKELGVLLLQRDRRSVRLTPAGACLLAEARRILDDVERATTLTRMVARGEHGTLRMGCMGPAVAAGLPAVIAAFRQDHPGVSVVLDEQSSVRQLAMLHDGALDIGVVRLHEEPPAWCRTRLFCRDAYVAAVPQDHALARAAWLDLAQLRDVPVILFPRHVGPHLYDAVIAACGAAGFSPNIVQELTTKSTTLALVAAGNGVAFVPASVARAGYNGVRFIPLRGALPPVLMYWAWRSDCDNPVAARFMERVPPAGEVD